MGGSRARSKMSLVRRRKSKFWSPSAHSLDWRSARGCQGRASSLDGRKRSENGGPHALEGFRISPQFSARALRWCTSLLVPHLALRMMSSICVLSTSACVRKNAEKCGRPRARAALVGQHANGPKRCHLAREISVANWPSARSKARRRRCVTKVRT